MFTGAEVFCSIPVGGGENRILIEGNVMNDVDVLPDIEFDIELGMFTGCDEFCSKPVEAKPADIEFSK